MAKDINSVQSGVVKENSVNNPSVQTYRGKNQFPQSFQHPSTCLYGYVDPVAVAKCEVGDIFPYKFVTDLNTFTMKSPLKSEVKMYSAAFKVPMEAIYPRTYDILFAFAQKGDEVPQNSPTSDGFLPNGSARAIFPLGSFLESISSYLEYCRSNLNISGYLRTIFLLETIFSDGGIFSKMNIHLNSLKWSIDGIRSSPSAYFDDFIDNILYPTLVECLNDYPEVIYIQHESGDTTESEGYPFYIPTTNTAFFNQRVSSDLFDGRGFYCSIDRFFELIRTGDWLVYFNSSDSPDNISFFNSIYFTLTPDSSANINIYLNIEPIVAYQLACIHFFNNPKIDYLYTAQLWRDNLQSIVYGLTSLPTFDYNGSQIIYDVCSYDFINAVINVLRDDSPESALDYFYHLFAYHRSLRYGDYFTGSRPEPIGVGDINLEEEDGSINSLEVARKLQLTRLLHKVAITGPEHSQQIKYIFGGRLPDVPKDVPIRLSLEQFDVTGFETNNTGAAQLSDDSPNITTTNLRLSDSKFMFEVEVNEPCWLVMVQYFEAHRIYANTIDRFAYHYDLYDDFVPDMQFVGDQDVKQSELMGVYGNQFSPFAYHLRNMEYKQRVSYASGGFLRKLPSWAFITDNKDGNPADANITPEYIRSSPTEFDRFYKSLTGHSLGSRFHFITMNTNVMAPYRQMVYAPEILA